MKLSIGWLFFFSNTQSHGIFVSNSQHVEQRRCVDLTTFDHYSMVQWYKVGYRHFILSTSMDVLYILIYDYHLTSLTICSNFLSPSTWTNQIERVDIYIVDDMENILDNIHSKSIEFSITKPHYIIRNKRSTNSTISMVWTFWSPTNTNWCT